MHEQAVGVLAPSTAVGGSDGGDVGVEPPPRVQLHPRMLEIFERITRELAFEPVADQVVAGVTEVLDFQVAALSLREGARVRRVAAAGVADPRLGLTTGVQDWQDLLAHGERRGRACVLIPPEAPRKWSETPDILPTLDPGRWHPLHGLIVVLEDQTGEPIAFLSVDEPRSGRLPDDDTIEQLELFARQAQVALVNARLYGQLESQVEAMRHVHQVTTSLSGTFDLQILLDRVVHGAVDRLGLSAAAVLERRGDGLDVLWTIGDPLPRFTDGDGTGRVPDGALDLPGVVADLEVLRREGALVVPDLDGAPGWVDLLGRSHGAVSFTMQGQAGDGRVKLVALHPDAGGFAPVDADLLSSLVELAALAIRQARLHAHVKHTAEHDPLTGMSNRRVFDLDLARWVGSASVVEPVALALLDVDDFKHVNDRHGHPVGDRVLCHVGDVLAASVRGRDGCYRIGGEEFALILPGADVTEAARVLERVERAVAAGPGGLPRVSISIGIAAVPRHGRTVGELYRAADRALYGAKGAGKARVVTAGASD